MTETNTYDIQLFENTEFGELTVLTFEDGEDIVWFIGKEVTTLLGYSNTRDALKKHVDDEDKNTVAIRDGNQKGNPNKVIINESGLYSLILSSKLPSAKKFKRWVTSEVLPTIRKTGGYVNNEDLFINTYLPNADEATRLMFKTQLATIKSLNDRVGELELTNAALAEKVTTWDDRRILNALVRSYANNRCNGEMQVAWNYFYKQINYALGINIWNRKSPTAKSRLDLLTEDELKSAVSVVAALCEHADLNVGKIIGETNAKNIKQSVVSST